MSLNGFPHSGPLAPAVEAPRGAFVLKGTMEQADPPRAAAGEPAAFYAGMHSSGLTKSFVDPATRAQLAEIGAEVRSCA